MKDKLAFCLATWFGAGLSPRAPGTFGSIAALPVYWALRFTPPIFTPIAILLVCVVGTWAAQRVSDRTGVEDPQIVVIDEVAGVFLALWIGGCDSLASGLLALLLFRLFDIFKPWPINALERLKPAGVGIMMDDIAAGAVAGLFVHMF